jgi:hypothetical protein
VVFLTCYIIFIFVADGTNRRRSRGKAVAAELVKNIRAGSSEKLYTNGQDRYAVTEKIWFKIFILDSVSDKLIAAPGTLWVDIVDQNDQPVSQIFQHTSHNESGGTTRYLTVLAPIYGCVHTRNSIL